MKTRLVESCEMANEVRHFVFETQDVDQFAFTPGQFVSFKAVVNGQEVTRAYSIASPPASTPASPPEGNRFELCLNRVVEGRLSPYLFELRPGDEADMKGPYGTFVLRQPPCDSVLVATGTRIAPFRSILLHHLPNEADRAFTLIFGVRYEDRLLYRAEFERLEREHPNFRFWPTLSRPGPSWQGRTGHVQEHLFEAIGDRRDLDVYVCGLKAMVNDVRDRLRSAGFERRRILCERYD